jgi:hypothetical protein
LPADFYLGVPPKNRGTEYVDRATVGAKGATNPAKKIVLVP